MLYACDLAFWSRTTARDEFAGLKVTGSPAASAKFPDLERVHIERRVDRLRLEHFASIGDGGNSGFQALNLVVQMGARQIVLVGFDMSLDAGVHWHGEHPLGMNNPRESNMPRWRAAFEAAAPELAALGVEVFNASPQSRLEAFRKTSLEEIPL